MASDNGCMKRRELLRGLAGWSAVGLAPWAGAQARRPRSAAHFNRDPFTLGVASGYPSPDGFVLWTRLAPQPLAPDGGLDPLVIPTQWEIATDERMRKVVRSGTSYATPEWAHSVHVEVSGLPSTRRYWYRFRAGGAVSPVGRTWTAAAPGSSLARLRLTVANCQQYEHGYYVAYRRMLEDEPDLIVHVGDYIYEQSWGTTPFVRHHEAGECYTLDDYRARYALYKSDPDLRAAHAHGPWLLTWDDHEVDNDYADDISEQDDDPVLFLQRRAAAYRAYYEHQPLPRQCVPFGPNLRLYQQSSHGDLARIYLLDERQYRSPGACPPPGYRGGHDVTQCPEREAENRTMFGSRQEEWLQAELADSRAQWNVLAQGVLMAQMNEQPGPIARYWTDAWNGYPAARRRLLQALADLRVSNPVVISGDLHAFVVSDLSLVPERPETAVIASEFLSTSLTSQQEPEDLLQSWLPQNPNTRFATGVWRGYVRLTLTRERLMGDLIGMDTVKRRESGSHVVKSYVIESGRPGLLTA
jgi:alkaline phosphatase D